MIVVRSLVKRFQGPSRGVVTAVDQLSFEVQAGEVYGLLGPNGAGKTTTLRVLATLLEPDSGSVHLGGVDLVAKPLQARQKLAYVPAEAGLPNRLTGREVVRMFAEIQGVSDVRVRADALLDELDAGDYADTPCGELSTGMKRRIVLARALVHEPQVLLLDEPTDGLDVHGRRDVLRRIREQAASGRAVVISSHIMAEVERVVDRLGVMTKGAMVAEGTPAEIVERTGSAGLDDAFIALVDNK